MRHAIVAFLGATALSVASAQMATAADMPTKAPAYAPVAMYNWTGFYLGGQVGGGWASNTVTHVDGGTAFPAGFVDNAITSSGILGGVYGGYNYQINQFLIGIDGDYSFASLTGSGPDVSPVNGDIDNHSDKVKWLSTVTGRLGYVNNNWLFFGKGGWGWAGFSGNSTLVTPGGALVNTSTSSTTRNGWTLGAGVEWGFLPNWSAKLEYDYVKFSTDNFNSTQTSAAGVVTTPARSATSDLNEVKLGVAYRF
jgi:outer membrane immunogenic protein